MPRLEKQRRPEWSGSTARKGQTAYLCWWQAPLETTQAAQWRRSEVRLWYMEPGPTTLRQRLRVQQSTAVQRWRTRSAEGVATLW
jgi:hypothetical protein